MSEVDIIKKIGGGAKGGTLATVVLSVAYMFYSTLQEIADDVSDTKDITEEIREAQEKEIEDREAIYIDWLKDQSK